LYHEKVTPTSEHIRYDFLVVGAGVAGLRAAIELAPSGRVLVVAKDSLRESSSEYVALIDTLNTWVALHCLTQPALRRCD
jgi:succinate dehydrogenase/fumarate reductase flavoprotein subunit